MLFVNTPHPSSYPVRIDGLDLTQYFHFTNRRNRPPLDLAYAASMLRRGLGEGVDLALLEANAAQLSVEETARRIAAQRPDVVVLNTAAFDRWICPYPSVKVPAQLLDATRALLRNVTLVVIGPHVTVFPESAMQEMGSADIGVVGEPEAPVWELVAAIASGNEPLDIPGTVVRLGPRDVELNPPARTVDLDENPFPLYEIMPLSPYQKFGYYKSDLYSFQGLSTFILSSRGCPFGCAFCALYIHRRGFRSRSPGNVVDELELLYRDHGVRIVRFQDPEFSIDRARTARICEMIIERGIQIAWSAETRYSSVDADLLELMKRSGCYQLNYGLESASQEVLDRIGKKQTVEEAEQSIRWTSSAGIHASNNLLFGLPGESKDTIEATLEFAQRMSRLPRVTFARPSLSVPYPKTPLYEMGVEDGVFDPIDSWREFPTIIRASGQIRTEFKTMRDVLRGIRRFKARIRRVEWSSRYGRMFWLNPAYYSRVVAPALLKRLSSRVGLRHVRPSEG